MAQAGDGTVTWRELWAETTDRLERAGLSTATVEARWIVEEASGMEGTELVLGLDESATVRTVAHLDALVARRLAGEPIQYVLGHWAFRHLDLLVDRRVLIPRPETEQVVEVALAALDQVRSGRPDRHRPVVVDLGTGSGAIALAVATERRGSRVWGVDRSAEALAVARANLAGLGMAGSGVALVEGDWFDGLPGELRGTIDLLVSNPPYIAADEPLDASVSDWEPVEALVPGPSGLESHEAIVAASVEWLAPGGVVVLEIGASQGAAVRALLERHGLADVEVHPDLAGLDRAVAGTRPA
ncbi:MAG: protein-(glutamine-N5) methyltransferase, release factor-specific [Ilumatobacteraceae bacterium]|nr:protein-(glutamine-N5) methyltransferase, release factor-specific [Ilumatobacteraceae bacterium]